MAQTKVGPNGKAGTTFNGVKIVSQGKVNNDKVGRNSYANLDAAKDVVSGLIGGYSADIDFFTEYNIPKYTDDNNTYMGYLPIEITTCKFKSSLGSNGELLSNVEDYDEDEKIRIVLPWKPQELRDAVSVSFDKKTNGNAAIDNVRQIGSSLLSDIFGSAGDLGAQFLTIDYRPETLKREISIDFILPLSGGGNLTIDINWVNNIRKCLGTLQGLVYPKGLAALYPPLLKIKVGNIYSGFKGYISAVELSFSEDQITADDGTVFPVVINGTIRFINLFTYCWSGKGDTGNLTPEFNLSNNPALLFGVQIADTKAEGASLRSSFNTTTASSATTETNSGDKKDEYSSSFVNEVLSDSEIDLNYDSFKKALVRSDANNKWLQGLTDDENILGNDEILTTELVTYLNEDYINDSILSTDVSNLYNSYLKNYSVVNNDNFEFLNLSVDNINTASNIMNKVNMVQTISDCANLIKNIKQGDAINILASLNQIMYGTSGTLNSNLNNILSATKVGTSIIRTLSNSGITLDNVAALFSSSSDLLNYVKNININSSDAKSKLGESLYAANLQSQQMYKLMNSVNSDVNILNDNSTNSLTTLTTLTNASNMLVSNSIFTNYDNYKNVISEIANKSDELFNSNIINTNMNNSINKMLSYIDNVDTDMINTSTDKLKSALSDIDSII